MLMKQFQSPDRTSLHISDKKSTLSKIAASLDVTGRDDKAHLRTKINGSGVKTSRLLGNQQHQ